MEVITLTKFVTGDVVRYETLTAPTHHCREGMAIAEARGDGRGILLIDTFWQSIGDRHILTAEEVATAKRVFNLADYDELDRYQHGSPEKWKQYKPVDRETVTSQHGLQVRWFIRKGAQPDIETQIENARMAVADAESKVRSAQQDAEFARRELARLEGQPSMTSSST